MTDSIGVAVIGGGMAGRAHAAGYRQRHTLSSAPTDPDVRLVAIADMNEAVADDTAKRYGYERAEYDWRAIADAPDIDAVSVVVANHLHREIVEGLLAAGKHVLCEKPLAGSLADAEAMVAAAEQLRPGHRGRLHLPTLPRRRDDPSRTGRGHAGRTGAFQRPLLVRLRAGSDLADHLALHAAAPAPARSPTSAATCWTCREFVCGPIVEVSGASFATIVTERPVPLGVTYGHTKGAVERRTGTGGERGRRHLHRHVRQRRGRHVLGVTGRAQPARRPGLRTVRLQGIGGLGSAPRRRVPDLHRRRPQRCRRARGAC